MGVLSAELNGTIVVTDFQMVEVMADWTVVGIEMAGSTRLTGSTLNQLHPSNSRIKTSFSSLLARHIFILLHSRVCNISVPEYKGFELLQNFNIYGCRYYCWFNLKLTSVFTITSVNVLCNHVHNYCQQQQYLSNWYLSSNAV